MLPTRTPSTQTQQIRRHRPWQEPSEASQMAKKTRALWDVGGRKKSWQQYPSESSVPPPGLSSKDLCRNYPNHFDGEFLIEMSDAGLKPRDMVEMMPTDNRNLHLGTEWSWIAERTKRAKWAWNNQQRGASQSVSVKVEDSNQPIRQAATTVTAEEPVCKTASRLQSIDHVQAPAFLQQLGTTSSEIPSTSQTPIGHGPQADSRFFLGASTMTAIPVQASSAHSSVIPHNGIAMSRVASTAGAARSVVRNSNPRTTSRGRRRIREAGDFDNYPPASQPLSAGLSRQQICRDYPNHLKGDILLRVVKGQGGEQGRWSARDIWDACPAAG